MIDLFQFQRAASTQIADRFIEYYADPVVKGSARHLKSVPFFQALAALTGAGKTVILADAVAQMAASLSVAPVILWLSKGKVVVEQSFINLAPGGKYNQLLGNAVVRPLIEYDPEEVAHTSNPSLFFATVGTFNQKDMEAGTLTIYRSDVDTTEQSIWDALRQREDENGSRRPLIVVYDEAQNLSDQQTDLLLRQEPDAFLVASATMKLPQLLATEVDRLKQDGRTDDWLVTAVRSSAVVSSGLVKSTLTLGGYRTPMEETVASMLEDMRAAEEDAQDYGLEGKPKAIYVCKTNILADDAMRRDDPKRPFSQRQAPPIQIWRYLVEQCGIDPSSIAVYANLDVNRDYPLPEEFVLFSGGDRDYTEFTKGNFQHIIFNLTLQEGWDDPNVYFAYIDKSMESNAQITQVIGRVLRQPGAVHYSAERLNTAHFYVRVDQNETFSEVLREVALRLGTDAPEIKIVATPPGREKPKELPVKERREIPRTAIHGADAVAPIERLLANMIDFTNDSSNTTGIGSRKVVQQKIGIAPTSGEDWQDFEHTNQVSARWVFHREVRRLYSEALNVASTVDRRFDAKVGINTPAYGEIADLAKKVVRTYIENATLVQRKPNPYPVGPIMAREDELEFFDNALHEGYAGLNSPESRFARALDACGYPWARNPSRAGYGIPLISVGATDDFYPDFILWTEKIIFCLDTKGPHILKGEAARKLLSIRTRRDATVRLDIRFISEGEWTSEMEQLSSDGCTIWGLKSDGKYRAQHFPSNDVAVEYLVNLGATADW
ncbi:hypothetical protein ACQEVF_24865 [Nonomuraea polychroma]|uniref:hypothetical protein n=1 Tax=Nonomuraea polychroma TaxID=46176 RepID=UPI003D8CBA4F